ncbi:hypothetical protein HPB50_018232 [Hyalomma asiaticum]|uniref:Uncharacterized protein n=1 Tax=Hyalomma asiaticum TaxID=266040 RepID=A0ACB7SR28_HYAAI|nr:hypothetical protein HPB50_018232 [Hyalomma asiaticum]
MRTAKPPHFIRCERKRNTAGAAPKGLARAKLDTSRAPSAPRRRAQANGGGSIAHIAKSRRRASACRLSKPSSRPHPFRLLLLSRHGTLLSPTALLLSPPKSRANLNPEESLSLLSALG